MLKLSSRFICMAHAIDIMDRHGLSNTKYVISTCHSKGDTVLAVYFVRQRVSLVGWGSTWVMKVNRCLHNDNFKRRVASSFIQ